MRETIKPDAKKATLRQGQPFPLKSTPADTEMNTSNLLIQPSNTDSTTPFAQGFSAPLVEDVDHDFAGTVAEYFGAVDDCPPGGFFLAGQRVCRDRQRDPYAPTARAPVGFGRWRLAGVDGVPRAGDQYAPAVIYSAQADAFLLTRRDNLKPRRLTFAQFVAQLHKHRQDLAKVSV